MTLISGLENPTFNTAYTVRGYYSETNFRDYILTADKIICAYADLTVSITPATESGNAGEFLEYIVSLTNAGPDPSVDVNVRVDLP